MNLLERVRVQLPQVKPDQRSDRYVSVLCQRCAHCDACPHLRKILSQAVRIAIIRCDEHVPAAFVRQKIPA